MKGKLISVLKVLIPLSIGVYVIWYQFSKLTDEQLSQITNSFAEANYFWVGLSVFFGLSSHFSRAYRWKYMIEPLGYKTSLTNNFFGVMIGYVANIVLPRFGEVWRCVMVSRYEKAPFEKLFGTVVAERVADMVVLLMIVATVFFMQLARLRDTAEDMLGSFLQANSMNELAIKGLIGAAVILLIVAILWRILVNSTNGFIIKIRNVIKGLVDGVLSILKMDKKWQFLAHTAFIWVMYLAMFYVPFLALGATSNASISAVLASFVMASFAIVLVQGGIGVYPVAVAQTLVLYGIDYEAGFAMGWIIWVAQTAMIIFFGVGSLILMPIVNSKEDKSV